MRKMSKIINCNEQDFENEILNGDVPDLVSFLGRMVWPL